ncbi:hypothetical protein HDU76_006262 [Blyttiomyces sp. JEL0837]|nr:hypothetical protein HDU76_006262 [Blyttiomyces sp. JEL0837]
MSFANVSGLEARAQKQPKALIRLALFMPYSIGNIAQYYDTLQNDLEIQLAISEVNNDPNILPDLFVDTLRANSWDPYHTWDYPIVDSGGYTGSGLIHGVIGDKFSRSSRFSAQMFSLFKIPTCGLQTSSTRLSNKNQYPYYFRLNDIVRGNYFVRLLEQFGATKIALVVGYDEISRSIVNDVLKSLKQSNIQILTRESISVGMFNAHNYEAAYWNLRSVDARYIVILATGDVTADFYFRSRSSQRNTTLVDSRHVWVGLSAPIPTSIPITKYGVNATNDLQGFVFMLSDAPDPNTPVVNKFFTRWNAMVSRDPRFHYQTPGLGSGVAYDCAKILLLGYDKLLKQNPKLTPEMLSYGMLGDFMNYSLFTNLSYDGVTYSPIKFNENGDLLTPHLYFSLNRTIFDQSSALTRDIAFGVVDSDGTQFQSIRPPIFYGGSTTPPPDGPVSEEISIAWDGVGGNTVKAMIAIGITLCAVIFAAMIKFRNRAEVKASSAPFISLFILGCLLGYISLFFFIGNVSKISCILRFALPLLASTIIYGSFCVKAARVFAIFYAKTPMRTPYLQDNYLIAVTMVIYAVAAALVYIWTLFVNPETYRPDPERSTTFHTCQFYDMATGNNKAPGLALFAYTGLQVLVSVYFAIMTISLPDIYGEAASLFSVTIFFVFACITVIPITNLMEPSNSILVLQISWIWVATTVFLLLRSWRILRLLKRAWIPKREHFHPHVTSSRDGSSHVSSSGVITFQMYYTKGYTRTSWKQANALLYNFDKKSWLTLDTLHLDEDKSYGIPVSVANVARSANVITIFDKIYPKIRSETDDEEDLNATANLQQEEEDQDAKSVSNGDSKKDLGSRVFVIELDDEKSAIDFEALLTKVVWSFPPTMSQSGSGGNTTGSIVIHYTDGTTSNISMGGKSAIGTSSGYMTKETHSMPPAAAKRVENAKEKEKDKSDTLQVPDTKRAVVVKETEVDETKGQEVKKIVTESLAVPTSEASPSDVSPVSPYSDADDVGLLPRK